MESERQHIKIADYVISMIEEGVYREGDKIPSEMELRVLFGVKRSIVRQAVARLADSGWVTPRQGKGSFVNRRKRPITYTISPVTSFSDNMDHLGMTHSSQLLNWLKRLPNEKEKSYLQLGDTAYVYELEILRYMDHHPISVTTTLLPEKVVPNFENHLADFRSLYQILTNVYRLKPKRVKSVIQARIPKSQDAERLGISENVPIVKISSTVSHLGKYPIEYSVSRIRGDMYKSIVRF